MSLNEDQILRGTRSARKRYAFDETHDPRKPVEFWFQRSEEGLVLFVVFYSQACRWSRCVGCNLPSKSSRAHVPFDALMSQVDSLLGHPGIRRRRRSLGKVIVSNNGSVLDEETFSSTALIYLIARLKSALPRMRSLSLETRPEYVDETELEFLARALREGTTETALELAIGFEAFDHRIRNRLFGKGLTLRTFDRLCRAVGRHAFRLKCYFMQKPVPGLSDEQAVRDIQAAIDYLHEKATSHRISINLHLNPTYAARGTPLESSLRKGRYQPPRLVDVARAVAHAEGKKLTVFVGLSDEGLACEGGGFVRPGDGGVLKALEGFNRTQDYGLLRPWLARGGAGT